MSFWRSLMTTQITRILDFLMNRLNMLIQTALCCSLILTQITRISQSHMRSLKVLFKFTFGLEMSITNFTKYFWNWSMFNFFLWLHPFFRHMDMVRLKISLNLNNNYLNGELSSLLARYNSFPFLGYHIQCLRRNINQLITTGKLHYPTDVWGIIKVPYKKKFCSVQLFILCKHQNKEKNSSEYEINDFKR